MTGKSYRQFFSSCIFIVASKYLFHLFYSTFLFIRVAFLILPSHMDLTMHMVHLVALDLTQEIPVNLSHTEAIMAKPTFCYPQLTGSRQLLLLLVRSRSVCQINIFLVINVLNAPMEVVLAQVQHQCKIVKNVQLVLFCLILYQKNVL